VVWCIYNLAGFMTTFKPPLNATTFREDSRLSKG
jgi:hypothetical protein